MTRKVDVGLHLFASDASPDAGTVFVTTDETPAALWKRYRALVSDADPRRIGIVNATGNTGAGAASKSSPGDGFRADGAGHPRVVSVGSPADLTGIGMKTSQLLKDLVADGVDRPRVGMFTLNTMAMYADDDRLSRFIHAFTGRLETADAFGLAVTHTDGLDEAVSSRIEAFIDGVVEVREAATDLEVRLRGLGTGTEWTPVELTAPTAHTETTAADDSDVAVPDSLQAAVTAVEAERPTLTLCNVPEADADPGVASLRSYFDAQDVHVRTADLETTTPRNVALLHRDAELLAASRVETLADAIAVDDSLAAADHVQPDVLAVLGDVTQPAADVDRGFLVEASRVVELAARRSRQGRIDAGFQDLSRLWNDDRTRRIYEGLAEAGVDVHVYGRADVATPADTGCAVHTLETEEIETFWFVVHDGGGDDERKAALVAEERDPGGFYGFWTRTPDRVDALSAYVQSNYDG